MLYPPEDAFPVGGSKIVRSSPDDQVTLIGAGVTLHNCLDAAEQLGGDGIRARVIDLYSLKPIDTATLLAAAEATSDRLVVVEDHYPEGGVGSAVLEALNDAGHPVRVVHLAVRDIPGIRDGRRANGGGGDLPLVVWSRPCVSSWADDIPAPFLISTSLATSRLFLGVVKPVMGVYVVSWCEGSYSADFLVLVLY